MKESQFAEHEKGVAFMDDKWPVIRMQSTKPLSRDDDESPLTDYTGQMVMSENGKEAIIAEFALTHVSFWNSPFDKFQTLDLRAELCEALPMIGEDDEYCAELQEFPESDLGFGLVYIGGIVVRTDLRGNGIGAAIFEYLRHYFDQKAEFMVAQAYPLRHLFPGAVMPADYYGLKDPVEGQDEDVPPADKASLKRLMSYYTDRVGFERLTGSDNHLVYHPTAYVLAPD